jgi:hypothetical protein
MQAYFDKYDEVEAIEKMEKNIPNNLVDFFLNHIEANDFWDDHRVWNDLFLAVDI